MNILYMGMADDIMAPLLLVPDLDTIYVIDYFDKCFSKDKTFKGQREDIKDILIKGSDIDSHSRSVYIEDLEYCKEKDWIHYLPYKSIILDEFFEDNVWRLKFRYGKKDINLIFYHDRNFRKEWPSEIQNIKHVMVMGAYSWDSFLDKERDSKILIEMLKSRTLKNYYFYALWFNHKHFPCKIIIKNSGERKGCKIARILIENNEDLIEQIIDPDY